MILKKNKYFAVFIILIFITQNLFSSVLSVFSVAKLNTFDINGINADVFQYDNLYRVTYTFSKGQTLEETLYVKEHNRIQQSVTQNLLLNTYYTEFNIFIVNIS